MEKIKETTWGDDIKIELIYTGCEDERYIYLVQNKAQSWAPEKIVGPNEPSSSMKDGRFFATLTGVGFSRNMLLGVAECDSSVINDGTFVTSN